MRAAGQKVGVTLATVTALALGGCGISGSLSSGPSASLGSGPGTAQAATRQATRARGAETVAVNRYIWQASLDVLNFLPIETIDPFTGVIVMGYGTPPGGGTAYRATVYVSDPALDARALNVALATRSGPVAEETRRTIENAILTRARELRVRDRGL